MKNIRLWLNTMEKLKNGATYLRRMERAERRLFLRGIETAYGDLMREEMVRLQNMPRVIKGRECPWRGGPQMWIKDYVRPENGIGQTLSIWIEHFAPGAHSQKHGHQNPALFYILSGRGYEVHDGERYDWEAGDAVYVRPGCVHQHFNADPNKPASALVINPKPIYMLMSLLFQDIVEPAPKEPSSEGYKPPEIIEVDELEKSRYASGTAVATYYREELLELHRYEEKKFELTKEVIKAEELPWEICEQGKLKHLANDKMPCRVKLVEAYIQEIAPGSYSGKHRHMAEEFLYIIEGSGYDLHWDPVVEIRDKYEWKWRDEPKKVSWETGDVVYIPPNVIHQHFNVDTKKRCRFISARSTIYKYAGYARVEQIENAPEWKT